MPLLAYRGFQQPADANTVVASITEDNLPPLLVLWLYFTTNPDFLTLSTPDTISQAQQFADIGNQLGLTAQCVSNLFRLATTHPASGSFNAVARIFQNVAAQSNYVAPGGRPCTLSSTVLKLAPAAKATVTPPVAV